MNHEVKQCNISGWINNRVRIFSSCQKDIAEAKVEAPAPPAQPEPVTDKKLKDSTLIYARDIFLWYNQIPSGSIHKLILIQMQL
jgi:hypothetical protein